MHAKERAKRLYLAGCEKSGVKPDKDFLDDPRFPTGATKPPHAGSRQACSTAWRWPVSPATKPFGCSSATPTGGLRIWRRRWA